MLRIGLLIALGTLALAGALAEDDAGLVAYNAGDYETALREWRLLAEGGSPQAQFDVGLLHYQGKGVAKDPAEAASWYRRAADNGFARAQYELARLYEQGEGLSRDLVHAHMWFNLAGKQGYHDAKQRRKRLAKQLTPRELAHAELYAREWLRASREARRGKK